MLNQKKFLQEKGSKGKMRSRLLAGMLALLVAVLMIGTENPFSGSTTVHAADLELMKLHREAGIQAGEIVQIVSETRDMTKTVAMKAAQEQEEEAERKARELAEKRKLAFEQALAEEKENAEMELIQREIYEKEMARIAEEKEREARKIKVTKNEREMLYRITEAEAGGEPIKGRILVVNVIINRVNSKKFPDTIEEVIFQKGQFSPCSNGSYYRVKPSKETKAAVDRALDGEDYSKGALYFATKQVTVGSWFEHSLTKVLSLGNHNFYR